MPITKKYLTELTYKVIGCAENACK